MERRRFTREFKLEAVRLIKERGVSFAPEQERSSGFNAAAVSCDAY
jgi:transposase-like protein